MAVGTLPYHHPRSGGGGGVSAEVTGVDGRWVVMAVGVSPSTLDGAGAVVVVRPSPGGR